MTETKNAVMLIQRKYGLNSDGIIGDKACFVTERLLNGFDYCNTWGNHPSRIWFKSPSNMTIF